MESPPTSLEQLLRRDRQLVVTALGLVAACAWAYTLFGAGMDASAVVERGANHTGNAGSIAHWSSQGWNAAHALTVLAMWWFMMVAMMLPSAAPTILLAAALNRRSDRNRSPYGAAGFFTGGYLLAWLLFSIVATATQWKLADSGLLSATMQSTSPYLTAGLVLAAGLWQLTPAKQACLRHCRSPVDYLVRHRRAGNRGALAMGMCHGAYCLGCCWAIMGLLFYAGVMNLLWVAGLALYVLLEKLTAAGERLNRYVGVALILAAAVLLAM